MIWKVEKYKPILGGNVTNPFTDVPCVAQIKCQSKRLNDQPSEYDSRHTCFINFFDGIPPSDNCGGVIINSDYDNQIYEFTHNIKLGQPSLADYMAILTTNEAYISFDPNHLEKTQIYAEVSPPELVSSTPGHGYLNIDLPKEIKITFNKYIQPANNYANISLEGSRFGKPLPISITKTINGNTLTVNLSAGASFSRATKYTVNIPENSIADRTLNPINQNYTITFTTKI